MLLDHVALPAQSVAGNIALAACAYALFVVGHFALHLLSSWALLRHVPGPPSSSFLWGEEWNLFYNSPGSYYCTWHKQFGRVVKFRGACGHQILSITDRRAISFILGSEGTYKFPKPDGVRAWFLRTLGERTKSLKDLPLIDSQEKEFCKVAHERQRRSLAPALTQQSVRNFTSIFYETSAKLAVQWGKVIDDSEFSDGVEIEVTNWAGRFALETIARAAFSYDFNLLSGEPSALIDALDGLTNNENKASSFYMRALFWVFPGILSIGKKGEMIRKTKDELGTIARNMWQDVKHGDSSAEKTLLSMMLKAPGAMLEEEEIVAQMRTILSAGWVLYELAINTKVQDDLRIELSSPGDIDQHSLLDFIVLEALRLHPPILENHHQASETIAVPLSESLPETSSSVLVIPKGTILFIPVNVMQTDPEIWGEDAHLFRPYRFQDRAMERQLFVFSEGHVIFFASSRATSLIIRISDLALASANVSL
ncbi:unnamed protein product [Mycena citricolor]|uniref:Cytochrome P450 n=1 Tax=Mycena citricolor TaxID=2018698 RepID=A0AAD2HS88_9AGAR|nr:unnamed protein product [Mycena citricolor]